MSNNPTNALLCDLIERVSVTPNDAGCQELIIERLGAIGFECESMPFGDVSNLWARRGNSGPLLCFAGHTDVVPSGPRDEWGSDPFSPTSKNGNLYGRGSADMKSGLAAMVVAAERFVALYPEHPGSLAFLITSDEEGPARDGTLKVVEALSARGESIDWCVVGEPSSSRTLGDVVRIGRRGSLTGKLVVKGTQGHVAYPQLADNPIRRFAPVLSALVDRNWDSGNEHFPPTSFEVVEMESGAGAPNVIPGELRARFNFRYSTEWTHQSLRKEVEALFERFDIDYFLDWHLSGEPFLTKPGKLISAVRQAVLDATGQEPELSTGGGTSDGRFISPAGADVVELGVVNQSIHKIDEHVDLEDPPKLADLYLRIAELLITR
jgi:succinyl-diaminopimelate desuccinylase